LDRNVKQLVFTDKSHFNQLMLRRPYVWSRCGKCTSQHKFQFHRAKYSILPALSLDGILHLEVIKNTVTSADFHCFVEGLLLRMNKWLLPLSVLIINNTSIHKVNGICELFEECSMHLLYLSSYSPDLNPIKLSFPSIKSWLHTNCIHVNQEMEVKDSRMVLCTMCYGRQSTWSLQIMQGFGTSTAGTPFPIDTSVAGA
jgi:hypothetical protein